MQNNPLIVTLVARLVLININANVVLNKLIFRETILDCLLSDKIGDTDEFIALFF